MRDELVELTRIPSSAEAAIVRSRLESEGIHPPMDGEAMAGWFWHFGGAVGVGVLVRRDDLERAAGILDDD